MSTYLKLKRQVLNLLNHDFQEMHFDWGRNPSRVDTAMQVFLTILEFLESEGDRQEFLDAIAQDDWESISEWTARLRQEWESEEDKEDEEDDD